MNEHAFRKALSAAAANDLEAMACRAREVTLRNFGRVIQLYAPLYLSNYCENECAYCGFKKSNPVQRKKLTIPQVTQEAQAIAASGLRHILVLTGGSREHTPVSYLAECIAVLRSYFTSVCIEVYPLEEAEYARLIAEGLDGLTVYQETYDRVVYARLHGEGDKKDFDYRLHAPERAARAGIRTLNIGALLGLRAVRDEAYDLGCHAAELQRRYPDVELGVSLPRIQPQVGDFQPAYQVSDRELVQVMLALRVFLPRVGITISTRESSRLRRNLIGLGVTRMSAGSRTEVGGYTLTEKTESQFDVADTSAVADVRRMISEQGYHPVMKDWQSV